jgi:DNA polymerase III epsilon subunit-like protein
METPSIGVIDVETTGLCPFRSDRVVEVAAVVATPDGEILREFVSLVNPERDIGPTRIHGLTSADVLDAPTFRDVAPFLVSALQGTVAIAGHNVRFDRQFLACECSRMGYDWPECPALCTMHLAGRGKLEACCERHGIGLDGEAHCALTDARATARLLACLLIGNRAAHSLMRSCPQIAWPAVPPGTRQPVTRQASRQCQDRPPDYLEHLLDNITAETMPRDLDAAALDYIGLLDRVLEDRRIDDCEVEELSEMAGHWGLDANQVLRVHRLYVDHVAAAAVADGIVTEAERRDLAMVCHLLGDSRTDLDAILSEASKGIEDTDFPSPMQSADREISAGTTVCFTGMSCCSLSGKPISRAKAARLAEEANLEVLSGVTKKLDILVVADPNTQSGKAKKAREYGTRVLHEPVFWAAIGVDVT